MNDFMHKLASVPVADVQDWVSRYRSTNKPSGPVSDFHIQTPTAAERASAPPIAGVNGVTQQDADNYWSAKHRELDANVDKWFGSNNAASDWLKYHRKNEATGEYNRKAIEQAAATGVAGAQRDAKQHMGFGAGMRNGYGSSQGMAQGGIGLFNTLRGKRDFKASDLAWWTNPVGWGLGAIGDLRDMWLSRHYVDKNWVKELNSRRLSDDPVERTRQLAYREAAAARANPEASTLRRQEHGAAHLEGSLHNGLYGWAVNPVIRRIPGHRMNDVAEMYTGLDTNSQATAYRMAATEDFGEEVARRAEQWLRIGGMGAYVAGAAVPMMLTGGQSAAAGTGGTGAAVTKTLGSMMGISNRERFMPALMNGLRMFRRTQPIAEGLRQAGHVADEGGLTDDPRRQMIGGVLQMGGDVVSTFPVYPVIDGALVSGLGGLGNMARATGLATRAKAVADAANVTTKAKKVLDWAGAPTRFAGRMLAGSTEAAGKFMTRQAIAEAYSTLEEGIEDDVMSLAEGKRPKGGFFDRYQGIRTRMIGRPLMKGVFNKFDSTASMFNAGDALAQQNASIDEMMADPAGVAEMKAAFGMPDATDEELRAMLPTMLSANRYQQSYAAALESLDKDFDWDGCTDQEYNAKWNSFTPEQRSDALFKAFRNDAATGGYIAPAVFTDPNLSQDQKQRLLGIYLQSEDNANGGTLVGQMFRGAKRVAVDAMRKSPQARQACIAYASGIVADALQDPSKLTDMDSGSVATAVLNEMTQDELKQMMEPLMSATPEQVMSLQKSLQANADSPVAQAGKDVIMKRLQTDGNFASRFIPQYTSAIRDGQGISQHDMDKMLKLVDDGGVDQMFGTMDDDSFFRFARWALSDEGSGMLDDMPGDRGQELKGVFEQAAKSRMWDAVKRNPFKNLPAATSLWFKSQGWDGMGDFAGNPGLFYGVMALLLGGAVWLGGSLFGEDDDDYIGDASDAVRVSEKQREILTKELFG